MVVSAPSGGGKTTLCHKLMATVPGVEFSVSHTTRKPRGQERDGVDYHFVDDAAFDALVANGELLEWAVVHGQRYGTHRREADDRLGRGVDVLFDIDIQGGRQIAEKIPDTVLVFVLPPDMATLSARLTNRKSDAAEVIERRLAAAKSEIAQSGFYGYFIVNDDLETAYNELCSVLISERLRRLDRRALLDHVMTRRAR
ncbi:MAG: guanylate kinase [Deltaproteobacteria bacterium]|nr:guanylate kinase [Deltaproteobacteria bacterium]